MMAAMKLFKPGIFLLPFVAVILLLGTLFVVVTPSQARRNTSLREEVIQTHTESAVERTCWARVNDDNTDYDSILDAGSQGRVVMIAGHITSTLEGLYITGGDADGLSGSGWRRKGVGGGIFVISSTVSINDNLIYSNTAAMGGGLFLVDSAASIIQNIIRDNVAEVYDVIYSDGGGLYLLESDALVRENLIETNQAGHNGGGMLALDCTPTIVANRLIGNTASLVSLI